MTAQIIPFQFKTTSVRTLEIDNLIWFVASDIAKALHYRDAEVATRYLDDDEKGVHQIGVPSQPVTIINESGLYTLILRSRKPEAQPFRKWVTSEVLPTIRKTGLYEASASITPEQQNALQQIVARKTGRDGKQRAGLWSRFNNHFRLGSYKQLPSAQFGDAVMYLERFEDAPQSLPAPTSIQKFLLTIENGTQTALEPLPPASQVIANDDIKAVFEDMTDVMGRYVRRFNVDQIYNPTTPSDNTRSL